MMVTTWEVKKISSLDPNIMRIELNEVVDAVLFRSHSKDFPKIRTKNEVLSQFALFIKQFRQQELDNRVPFNTLDLSDFEDKVRTA